MSYDVYVMADVGGPELIDVSGGGLNYTSNCAPMWRAAGADIAHFHGIPARACLPTLKSAIAEMEAHPEVYEPMNPGNGWGSYESVIECFLLPMVALFESAPNGIVKVSR